MTGGDVLEIGREAVWVILKVGGPLMILALVVGLAISLLQALTQIQEMTVSFVPKMFAIFIGLLFFIPYMSLVLESFTEVIFSRIQNIER